jgi:hypothetical protein
MYTKSISFAALVVLASNIALSSAAFTYNSCQSASAITASSFISSVNSTFMSVGLCSQQCIDYSFLALYDTYVPSTFPKPLFLPNTVLNILSQSMFLWNKPLSIKLQRHERRLQYPMSRIRCRFLRWRKWSQ